jgi:glutaryl-CoA dehydrogenase
MTTDIALGTLGCIQLGRLKDSGNLNPVMISIMKRNNCQKSLDITR